MMEWVFNKRHSPPLGNRDEMMAPHGVYPSKGNDKWVTIAVKTEDEWHALCVAMERPELAEDDRFADQYLRQNNHDALDEIIAAWTKSKTHFQVTRTLQKVGVAAFPSLNQKEVFDDRHYKAREDWVDVDHPPRQAEDLRDALEAEQDAGTDTPAGNDGRPVQRLRLSRSAWDAKGRDRPPRRGERVLLGAALGARLCRRAARRSRRGCSPCLDR